MSVITRQNVIRRIRRKVEAENKVLHILDKANEPPFIFAQVTDYSTSDQYYSLEELLEAYPVLRGIEKMEDEV